MNQKKENILKNLSSVKKEKIVLDCLNESAKGLKIE